MLRKLVLVGSLIVLLLATTGGAVAQEPVAPNEQDAGPVTVQADVGTGFTYQGQLAKEDVPVNGACDLQFGLWAAATGGTQLGTTQTVTNVSVSKGLFTVQLNTGAQFGPNAFNGQKRYLQIQVRCPAGSGGYTTLAPRQELTAAPYAMHAFRASGLSAADGDPLSAVTVDNNGNVGIGTVSPAHRLDVKAKLIKLGLEENGGGQLILTNNPADNRIFLEALSTDGSGHAAELLLTGKWGGNVPQLSLLADRTFINGNVGIGTAAPATKLHVADGSIRLGSGAVRLDLELGAAADIRGYPHLWINNNTEGRPTFINPGTGNVGIGTTSPQAKLDVAGRTRTDVLQIDGGADLAEPFAVAGQPEPGHVVAIDPENAGQLRLADRPYDRMAAGVISGAGGLNPGLVMQQPEIVQGETVPVALCGRVYVWADASYGTIQIGDLLTTSATPGFAMRVSDHQQAQGAILGKAMNPLQEGQGLVLVLVTLQ